MAKLDISLTLTTAKLSTMKDAIAANNSYNPTTDGTKAAFATQQAKRVLTEWAKDQFRRYVENQATAGVDIDPVIT